MATREIPSQLDPDETDEQFERRIKETKIEPVKRGSIMTEEPLLGTDEDDDERIKTPPLSAPSILGEEPLEDDDDTD